MEVEDYVFVFDVSMNHTVGMAMTHGLDDLQGRKTTIYIISE